ncbi:uncharacterized protein LOC113073276 [Tachysurus ichikawai]
MGSKGPLQTELHQCTQRVDQLALDVRKVKLLSSTAMASVSVQTITSPPFNGTESPVVSSRLPRIHPVLQNIQTPNDSLRSKNLGSNPIKIQFPCFGHIEDNPDPVFFLEKCQDFLAVYPLSEEELLATLRNVLHGTARDWWDVARLETFTWVDFEHKFLEAFLSEDYEDELAERVQTRVQKEGEGIRDFTYMYRALCKRWKPGIEENEVIKEH